MLHPLPRWSGGEFSIPSAEGCPGIRTLWGNEFRSLIECGVRCAEAWLDDSSLPLWWQMARDPQEAFEAGFLLRLQQTLIMRREAPTSQSTSFDA
ncbi:LasR-specific antiactivator QslA [Pseudomonas sp. W3I7]|uniref:LasR-specific antiactivator QslA n=1 Tax=Pseudomonas sp. W3I7 TaxID=3042292 RepID=UPI0027D7C7D2|nr:LasR-specific antiactivator QslA [Pseudomonas sp. W3I7]